MKTKPCEKASEESRTEQSAREKKDRNPTGR